MDPNLNFQWTLLTVADEDVAYAIAPSEFHDNRGRNVALVAFLQEKATMVIIDFAKDGAFYGGSYANEAAKKAGFVNVFRDYWKENQEAIGQQLKNASF